MTTSTTKFILEKKRRRVTKEWPKKTNKTNNDIIEVGESEEGEEEEMARIKRRDFQMHHLITIRGEMNEEFTKTTNKQGKFVLKQIMSQFNKKNNKNLNKI